MAEVVCLLGISRLLPPWVYPDSYLPGLSNPNSLHHTVNSLTLCRHGLRAGGSLTVGTSQSCIWSVLRCRLSINRAGYDGTLGSLRREVLESKTMRPTWALGCSTVVVLTRWGRGYHELPWGQSK